jgi:hypothetical protein
LPDITDRGSSVGAGARSNSVGNWLVGLQSKRSLPVAASSWKPRGKFSSQVSRPLRARPSAYSCVASTYRRWIASSLSRRLVISTSSSALRLARM